MTAIQPRVETRVARDDRRLATERGLRPFEKDFDLLEGEALRALGDNEGARAALLRAVASSDAVGARRLLWQAHGSLAAIADDMFVPLEHKEFIERHRPPGPPDERDSESGS